MIFDIVHIIRNGWWNGVETLNRKIELRFEYLKVWLHAMEKEFLMLL